MWGCIMPFWPSPLGSQNLRHQHGGRTSVSCLRNRLGSSTGNSWPELCEIPAFPRVSHPFHLFPRPEWQEKPESKPQIQRIVQTHNKSIVRDHFPIPGMLGDSRMKERVKYLQSMFSTLLLVGLAGKSIQHLE